VFLTESAQSIGVIAIFLAVVLRRNVDMEAPVLLTNRRTSSQGEAFSSQEKFLWNQILWKRRVPSMATER
jgi:hypothetical protein